LTAVPFFRAADVAAAVSHEHSLELVRAAFIAYHRGEWTMPLKVYVPAYPAGDFRAMPALGGGHAALKWVTSFPGNPARGLPTAGGLVLLSNAEDGQLVALLDAAAVTWLRTGAAAVLAAETLGRNDAETAAVVGAGVNGTAAARTFIARGRSVSLFDVDSARAQEAAADLGAAVAGSLDEALSADLVVTVTPGHEPVIGEGRLRPGQHVSLMGADGPGKAEIAAAELLRTRVFCDDWEQGSTEGTVRLFCDDWTQASHGGELATAVKDGLVTREQVTDLGAVLAGEAPGRQDGTDVTLFDSTGLAIQDLAIALAALEGADQLDLLTLDL